MEDFKKKLKKTFETDEAKAYMADLAKKGASARWANHKKMTDEEKRAKNAARQREYRARQKQLNKKPID